MSLFYFDFVICLIIYCYCLLFLIISYYVLLFLMMSYHLLIFLNMSRQREPEQIRHGQQARGQTDTCLNNKYHEIVLNKKNY